MRRERALAFVRSNAIGLLALFAVLGGTAVATTQGVRHGGNTAQSAKKKKEKPHIVVGATGINGNDGRVGATGATGVTGVTGPTGPVYGESSNGASTQNVNATGNSGGSIGTGITVNTPIAGKLYAFGHVEGAAVNCAGGISIVRAGLFVDGTQVPGTTWEFSPGTAKDLTFAGVTASSLAAGSHTVVPMVECFPNGMGPFLNASDQDDGFGAIVLGG